MVVRVTGLRFSMNELGPAACTAIKAASLQSFGISPSSVLTRDSLHIAPVMVPDSGLVSAK